MSNENKKIVPKTKFRSYQENTNILSLKNEITQKQAELEKEIEDLKKQKEDELKQAIIEREKIILEKKFQFELEDGIKMKMKAANGYKSSLSEEEKKQAMKEYQKEYQRIYYWLHKKGLSLDEALERANRQKLSDIVPDKKTRAKIYSERFKEKKNQVQIILVQE